MIRTRSYKLVDKLLNHPDIRPTIEKGDYYVCSAELISHPRNLFYICEHGVVFFIHLHHDVYGGHYGFLRSGRGKVARQATRDAIDDLFSRHGATKLVAAIPLQLRAARLLCRLVGLRSIGQDDQQEHFVIEGGPAWAA